MMIFRNGGRTPKAAEIFIQNKKLKIVPDYKYLGMTLQTSARSYSKHIAERATQAVRAMHDVQKLKSLSIKTAMALFKSKIMPILTYGIEIIWEKLSMANLKTIEKVKATYLKKAIGVSKNTRSRLVYLLARETFLIEDLRMTMTLPRTNASEQLLTILREKREATPVEFYGTGAMIDREWTKENFELRHVLTRLAVHGFHHRICKTTAYHEPEDSCVCSLCENKCERYHIELCTKRTKSISEYAKL